MSTYRMRGTVTGRCPTTPNLQDPAGHDLAGLHGDRMTVGTRFCLIVLEDERASLGPRCQLVGLETITAVALRVAEVALRAFTQHLSAPLSRAEQTQIVLVPGVDEHPQPWPATTIRSQLLPHHKVVIYRDLRFHEAVLLAKALGLNLEDMQ